MSLVRSPIGASSSNPNLTALDLDTSPKFINTAQRKRKFDKMDSSLKDTLESLKTEILNSVNSLRKEQGDKIQKLSESIDIGIKDELSKLSACFSDLKCSLELTDRDLKDTNKKVCDIEKRVTKTEKLEKQVANLQDTVFKLQTENNLQQQWARQLNVELFGIPESCDVSDAILRLSKHVEANLVAEDILSTSRVQSMNPMKGQPRKIIARMKNRVIKDNFISSVKKHRGLSSSDLGLPGEPFKIFANDHLTSQNKMLYKSCRAKASELGFKYVWIKNCKIYMRRDDTSTHIIINTEKDLKKLT